MLTTRRIIDCGHGYEFRVLDGEQPGDVVIEYAEERDGALTVIESISLHGGAIRLLGQAILEKADELGVPVIENA